MNPDLTILCVSKAEPFALPFLARMVVVAKRIGAESLTCVDGNGRFSYGNTYRVHSSGFIESVLTECVSQCTTKYVLRLDDDEQVSPALEQWLKDGGYRAAPHWKFPRVHLWNDEQHFINVAPLWPDHQTRLSLKELSSGRTTVHAGSPHGGGKLCEFPIEHHKFLVKDFQERKEIGERYDRVQPGSGSGVMTAFNLPEVAFEGKVPSVRYVDQLQVIQALKVANEIGMHQHQQEIRTLAEWLATQDLKNVLEIGTLKGGTAALWHGLCTGKVVTIDMPGGRFGGADHGYTEDSVAKRNVELEQRFPRLITIARDSHLETTVFTAKNEVGEEQYDLLFIDGDHTYEGVKQDFEMYRELLRPGGIIVFHDILDTKFHHRAGCYVDKLWRELPPHKAEIVAGDGNWGGIGITFR